MLGTISNVSKRNVYETEALKLITMVVDFQRKLEYYKESISIFSGRPYFERTMIRFQTIIGYFSTEKILRISKSTYQDSFQQRVEGLYEMSYCDCLEGIVYEAKQLLKRARANVQTTTQRSLNLIDEFLQEEVRPALIELYGDLRLLASLAIFPEEKTKIKQQLLDEEFKQVVEFLEIADQNYTLTPPHLKDTLSNCRNALEIMITTLLSKSGLKPAQRFSMDVGTLSSTGLLDRETKDVVLSVWSYLSMKGSHPYSKIDKNSISDVDFGLEQTYRVISLLLTKHQDHMKNRTTIRKEPLTS